MGHFSHTCKLTGLPITGGTPVILFPIISKDNLYDNSEEHLKKYGTTYQCSNDGVRLKFNPCWFPIKGVYDDYGGLEDIVHDDNTKVIEDYFDLTIEQIVNIITCGRKDDGYSDVLNCIKDLNVEDEYGKPKYQERYREFLPISGMWIHLDVYEKLVKEKIHDHGYDCLDLGTPELLKAFGFVEIEKDENTKRYNRQFKNGDLIINSDGTWAKFKDTKEFIYRLPEFAKYCKERGVDIDMKTHGGKDKYEQIYDYLIPEIVTITSLRDLNEKQREELFKDKTNDEIMLLKLDMLDDNSQIRSLKHSFLNYNDYKIINTMTVPYYNAARNGKLKKNLVEFWRFHNYMFCLGRYYAPVGTAPQDGEYEMVQKVLNISNDIINEMVQKRDDY